MQESELYVEICEISNMIIHEGRKSITLMGFDDQICSRHSFTFGQRPKYEICKLSVSVCTPFEALSHL